MPITPGAAGASFDVLLAFSLDAEANARVKSGITTMNQELERLQKEAAGVGDSYKESGEKVTKTNEQIKKETQDLKRQLLDEARQLSKQASAMVDGAKAAQIGALKNISGLLGGISQSALLAGGALTGGIFAEVQNYVNNSGKRATEITEAWKTATDSLAVSRRRVDETLAREALPLLQQAAKVATQASKFVQSHPEIVQAALKTGVVLAGLGTIGILVSKGIKLVADIKYLSTIPAQIAAAKLQDEAANKQLKAAGLQAGKAATLPGGGASLLKPIPLLALTAGAGLYSAIGRGAANFGASLFGTTPEKFWKDLIGKVSESLPWVKKFTDSIFKLGDVAKDAASDISQASGQIAGSAHEAEVVSAFQSFKEDDARLVSEAAENRKKIIEEGEAEIVNITKRYTDQRTSINAQFNEKRADIISKYNEDVQKAEEQYQQARLDAKKNEAEQLAKIEEDRQERLREIQKDGAERLSELAAARDALGLVKEQRKIDDETAEANRSAQRAKEQVRRETEARLQELAAQYAAEQAQRAKQFAQDLAQNEAQRQAELKQAQEEYQAEIKSQREATAAKLRDLQEGLNAERLRRREVFIQQIRDLDSSLLGERNLKANYYRLMLQDAQIWLDNYRRTLSGALPTGTTGGIVHNASGGYASYGPHILGEQGREYVMTNQTTKAAERIIGGSLTQDNLLRALMAGSVRNVEYNDYRKMNGPTSKDDRALLQRAAEAAILQALGA